MSHCGFDLHFPDDAWCCACFPVPVGHLSVFFGNVSIQPFCLCLNWVVCFLLLLTCMSSLYILDVNPSLDIPFISIFSHSVSCLSISDGFLSCAEVYSLIHFAFVFLAWGDMSGKISLRLMSKSILPTFSSRSLMASRLIFKPKPFWTDLCVW